MKCKIFVDNSEPTLEREINAWLQEETRLITHVVQSEGRYDESLWITITIFYN